MRMKKTSSYPLPVWQMLFGIIISAGCYYFTLDSDSMRVKTVQIADGSIRGVRETSLRKQVDFYAFRGIPFAKPPLGELRFKVNF